MHFAKLFKHCFFCCNCGFGFCRISALRLVVVPRSPFTPAAVTSQAQGSFLACGQTTGNLSLACSWRWAAVCGRKFWQGVKVAGLGRGRGREQYGESVWFCWCYVITDGQNLDCTRNGLNRGSEWPGNVLMWELNICAVLPHGGLSSPCSILHLLLWGSGMENMLCFEGRIRSHFSYKCVTEREVFEMLYFRFIRESMGLSKTRTARQFLKLPLFLMKVWGSILKKVAISTCCWLQVCITSTR